VATLIDETPDTRTFVLEPNRNWPGHAAGQSVPVTVEIDGVRHQRTYSISDASAPRRVSITVKRQPGGTVSNWMHDHLQVGSVVELGRPAGTFVLPTPVPTRLLMVSAGSGITPLRAMLRELHRRAYAGDVVFVHACRARADAIFGGELAALAERWPALRLHPHYTSESGRLDGRALAALVSDHAGRHLLLCGPDGFMAAVRAHWQARGLGDLVQVEHFGVPRTAAPPGEAVDVHCLRSQRTFRAEGGDSLLPQAERAGLRPRHGCRVGICHTCQCVKRSGTVENLMTGRVSSEPNERIQLCISRARTDVALDL
jgi:ferredoxin-NADP reductase